MTMLFIGSRSHAENQRNNGVEHRHNEAVAVESVHDAAMTGEDGSEILFAEVPLDNGRRKVAADADSGEEHRCCGNHPPLYCVVLEEEIIKNEEESEVEEHSYNYSADCALNTLFRADIRSELMLAELSADKIRKCVVEPCGQQRRKDNKEHMRLLEQIRTAQAEIPEQGYCRHLQTLFSYSCRA